MKKKISVSNLYRVAAPLCDWSDCLPIVVDEKYPAEVSVNCYRFALPSSTLNVRF